jgi:hypothetical protein
MRWTGSSLNYVDSPNRATAENRNEASNIIRVSSYLATILHRMTVGEKNACGKTQILWGKIIP